MAYFIKDGYVERPDNDPCDERGLDDQCQRCVYEYASHLPGIASVLDIGCGGAARLLEFFSHCITIGTDVEPTVTWLRQTHPRRTWVRSEYLNKLILPGFDLVICADVIEHLKDPDELLRCIRNSRPRQLVISTPDRDRLQQAFWNGPPKNLSHVREWSYDEFHRYIGASFDIIEHVPAAAGASTQFIFARCL